MPVGVGAAVVVPAGVPGAETGAPGEPVELGGVAGPVTGPEVPGVLTAVVEPVADELVEELQAVNSTAIKASEAQAATCRGLGAFRVLMMSNPFNVVSQLRRGAPRGGWKSLAAKLTPRPVRNKKDG